MSFNYKAIFVDLDGTLLNSKKYIIPKFKDVLITLLRAGIHVVIATGRTINHQ